MNIYRVYNHNNTFLGEFANPADALKEALYYRQQTGNPAYVEQEQVRQKQAVTEQDIHALIKQHKNEILDSCDWWWGFDDYSLNVFCYDDKYEEDGRLSPNALFQINLYEVDEDGNDNYSEYDTFKPLTLREIRLL